LLFTPLKTPEGRFYEITGEASYGRLLSGLVGSSTVVPPEGDAQLITLPFEGAVPSA
jgi:hypothetical protein